MLWHSIQKTRIYILQHQKTKLNSNINKKKKYTQSMANTTLNTFKINSHKQMYLKQLKFTSLFFFLNTSIVIEILLYLSNKYPPIYKS